MRQSRDVANCPKRTCCRQHVDEEPSKGQMQTSPEAHNVLRGYRLLRPFGVEPLATVLSSKSLAAVRALRTRRVCLAAKPSLSSSVTLLYRWVGFNGDLVRFTTTRPTRKNDD